MAKEISNFVEEITPVIEIEFSSQLKDVAEDDWINTQKMLEGLAKSEINPNMEDELVISNEKGRIISAYKNKEDKIFERQYKISPAGKLVDINSITLFEMSGKYFTYNKKLKREVKGGFE